VNNYDTSTPFGTVNLVQAMTNSINSVFCNMGKALGCLDIVKTMQRLGFYSVPPLETPVNEREASGLYNAAGKLVDPKNEGQVDPGRLAFGQGPSHAEPKVTPLQLAMVGAAIANGGELMKPHAVDRIVAPDGSTVVRTRPDKLGQVVEAEHARSIAEMMEQVVSGGTGTAAALPGIRVAGKTGTAETGREGRNITSFVAFAPADRPRVAVAVMLENQSGTGGTTAAPIAREIMQALIG
jgi:peptidoglycan glycosyltransferase